MNPPPSTGPLAGLKVLDLSRVLAGPWSTQVLGDLGADIIKIEQPGQGDDTRKWGPPFLDDGSGDAAYYLCANRNKRSIAIDMAKPEGAALIRQLAAKCDIAVENFRVGGLAKYGLDYASLHAVNPALIYCSITGFGQTGPYKNLGGYDFLVQGMSGLMSVTGRSDDAPGAGPIKVGTPTVDLSTGLYAVISILAALHHRHSTGLGQHIDIALFDTQMALMANQASNALVANLTPRRMANEHPTLVPYRDFTTADGSIIIALGNDRQFSGFCSVIGCAALASDPRFEKGSGRAVNRAALYAEIEPRIVAWTSEALIAALESAKLPCGRINSVPEALADPQVTARALVKTLHRPDGTAIKVVGYPAQFSSTPADYRAAPPKAGEHTGEILAELLGLNESEVAALCEIGAIATDSSSLPLLER